MEAVKAHSKLFDSMRAIGKRLSEGFQTLNDKFYAEAIPEAKKILSDKPWLLPEYEEYRHTDEFDSARAFIRAALDESTDMSFQQAWILIMVLRDGLVYEDIAGIAFRKLLKVAMNATLLSKAQRKKLLTVARTAISLPNFEVEIRHVVEGLHAKNETFVRRGSESAVRQIEEFEKRTDLLGDSRPSIERTADQVETLMAKAKGEVREQLATVRDNMREIIDAASPDDRPGIERLSDQLTLAMAEPDFDDDYRLTLVLTAFCRFMKKITPAFSKVPDKVIMAKLILQTWKGYDSLFDEDDSLEFGMVSKVLTDET